MSKWDKFELTLVLTLISDLIFTYSIIILYKTQNLFNFMSVIILI